MIEETQSPSDLDTLLNLSRGMESRCQTGDGNFFPFLNAFVDIALLNNINVNRGSMPFFISEHKDFTTLKSNEYEGNLHSILDQNPKIIFRKFST